MSAQAGFAALPASRTCVPRLLLYNQTHQTYTCFFFLIRYRERSGSYVFHIKELQYHAKPDKPDALFAKKLQEILGGQFGELAIKELEAKENVVVSSTFPRNLEKREVSRVLFNFSRGNESAAGRWAKGRSIDGEGVFHM